MPSRRRTRDLQTRAPVRQSSHDVGRTHGVPLGHDGEALFQLACANDLEGIGAKRKYDPYLPNQASWLKIRNPNYTQWEGREELFNRASANLIPILVLGTIAREPATIK